MSLVKRLWLTIAFTLLSLVLALSLTGVQLYSLTHQFEQYRQRQALSAHLNQLKAAMLSLARADPMLDSTARQLADTSRQVQQLRGDILPALPSERRDSFDQTLTQRWEAFTRQIASALKIAETSPEDALNIPDAAYKMHMLPLIEAIDQQLQAEHDGLSMVEADMQTTVGRLLFAILGPLVLVGIVVVLLQLATARALKNRILMMCLAADKIAAGNTAARLPDTSQDELGQAARHVNLALDKLLEVMQDVHVSAIHSEGQSQQVLELTTRVVEQTRQQIQYGEQSQQVAQLLAGLSADILQQSREAGGLSSTRLQAKLESTVAELQKLGRAVEDISQLGLRIRDMAEQSSLLAHEAAVEATKVRRMTDKELIFFRRSDEHYQRLAERHRDKLSQLGSRPEVLGSTQGETTIRASHSGPHTAQAHDAG
ncbi:methyl-accepting chemotaxis protein [Aquitalea palustris]|uniref:Methyl-accepting chemotaxis protein n=1 Tax=Aquitalea palustris TaxID=2480983 RepID=A0A454JLL7_9NEIS|nr:methyl-accepting chemotaxis protein [Aquitalea palustris]RMD00784.1 methyl-accepting chemotaxis protein [Aquitalea palustris]